MTPESLKAQPLLRQWLALVPQTQSLDHGQGHGQGHAQEKIQVQAFSGKVDLGQGISHALRLIVAETLRLAPEQVHMVPASTRYSPDEAVTSGSLSVQHSGAALRCAAAHLREACRQAMALRCGVALTQVWCEQGRFWAQGVATSASYSDLFNTAMGDSAIAPEHVTSAHAQRDLCSPPSHTQRPDVAAKVLGEFEFIQDRVLPGMCHGMVFRPGTLNAQVIESDMQALLAQLQDTNGPFQHDLVCVQRDGLLLGVVTESEHSLLLIAKKIEDGCEKGLYWRCQAEVPNPQDLPAWLKAQALDTRVVADTTPQAHSATALAQRMSAEFHRPYWQHASIGLCCALAHWPQQNPQAHQALALEVWSHSQGIYNLRRDLALAFGLAPDQVQVSHAESAGCYGHNGADDVAFDAAWLARQVPGRPLRVQWTRQAELGHAPLAPAMAVRIDAALSPEGLLLDWSQTVWSQGHGTRPGRGLTPALLGAWQTHNPAPVNLAVNAAMAVGGGSERNAQPPYDIAAVKVVNHRVLNMPFRVSAMRALGAPANVFAAESFMDELAQSVAQDSLAFRLAHLRSSGQERAVAVLQRAAEMAGWSKPRPANAPEGWGQGLAYARYKNTGAYCAVVVALVVAEQVKLQHIWIAADLGHVVDAQGAINQLEGGALQAASWALCEAAQLSPQGIASNDWTRYPILKFSDMPEVTVALMPAAEHASLGAGECSSGPACAAIANAIANAIGVRMRSMPFTPENLLKTIHADPVSPSTLTH